jgi:sugar phosphate isomerase/epimerase
MKLAVSNLAWPVESDGAAAELLGRHGVRAIELAPTKVWPRPAEATEEDVIAYRAFWERRGFQIVALQALLFGRPDLTLFDDPGTRGHTFDYLCRIMRLASCLGAGVLVFGSPGNRRVNGRPPAEVRPVAVDLFRRLGEAAHRHGVSFCIEPNPPAYGCDFVTTVEQGAQLVAEVGHPGFGLHLDAGGMALAGESLERVGAVGPRHFHISEPHLCPIGTGSTPHAVYAEQLRQVGYERWCSVEMRMAERDWLVILDESLAQAGRLYRLGG